MSQHPEQDQCLRIVVEQPRGAHEVIHDEFPNYSLMIKVEALSPDERGRVAESLGRALDRLGQREGVSAKTAA